MSASGFLRADDAASEFETHISCIKCGEKGIVTWARNVARYGVKMTATSPIRTSDGFHLRVSRSSNPHIVCEKCGTVHRDMVS